MEQNVEVIIKETITEHVNVDKALSDRVKILVDKALDEVEDILDFGTADAKQAIVRTLLSASTRQLGKDFTTTENEARLALERLFEGQRVLPEADPNVIELAPSTPRIDDSNERTDH
jgi:hypothetical protein